MVIDSAMIPHYDAEMIPFETLKGLVRLNPTYLKEKPTWYSIDGQMQYFKVRSDLRLFTEMFFSLFARETLDLDTADYSLAYIKNKGNGEKQDKVLGLLSPSFQVSDCNYYLISELLKSENSDLCSYGGFSLENMLSFFSANVAEREYTSLKDFLIRVFIGDGSALQVDRNINNIGFEIKRIDGILHTKRLRPQVLASIIGMNNDFIEIADGMPKLTYICPSLVYDGERILGVDHNFVHSYNPNDVWTPIFPYSCDLLFDPKDQVRAREIRDNVYGGIDPNLAELYLNYPNESKTHIFRLAHDDSYKKLLETFSKPNSPLRLCRDELKLFGGIMEDRRKEFKKVLEIG